MNSLEIVKKYDMENGIVRNYDFVDNIDALAAMLTPGNHTGDIELVEWPEIPENLPWEQYEKVRYGWIDEMLLRGDTYHYAMPREDFNKFVAFEEAKKLGKKFLILEDLS